VYSRQLDGQTLTLAASGWTYNHTFVLYDLETETLWYPVSGQSGGLTGISGPLRDRVLPLIESARMSWREWREQNPETKFMDTPNAYPRMRF
jgi:hypothetical protein